MSIKNPRTRKSNLLKKKSKELIAFRSFSASKIGLFALAFGLVCGLVIYLSHAIQPNQMIGNCHGDSIFDVKPTDIRSCPDESFAAFRNPDKGWITYDFHPVCDKTTPDTTLLSSMLRSPRITWADLEPSEGNFQWSLVDAEISKAKSLNHSMQLNLDMKLFSAGYCGHPSIPSWLTDPAPNGYNVPYGVFNFTGNDGGPDSAYEIKYNDQVFLQKFSDFIQAFASHYYATPNWQTNIRGIDINDYGPFGEWHSQFCFSDDNANKYVNGHDATTTCQAGTDAEVRLNHVSIKALVDIYLNAFQSHELKPWLQKDVQGTSKASHYPLYTDIQNDENGDPISGNPNRDADKDIFYSIEAPGFQTQMVRRAAGGGMYDGRALKPDEQLFIKDHVINQPFIGEWGVKCGLSYSCNKDGDFTAVTQQMLDQLLNYHATGLGWYETSEAIKCSEFTKNDGSLQDWFIKWRAGFTPEVNNCQTPVGTCTRSCPNHIDIKPLEDHHYDPSLIDSSDLSNGKGPPKYCQPQTHEVLRDYFQRCSGYNFFVSESVYPAQIQAGNGLALQQAWYQRAVAKLYRQHYLRAYLVQGDSRIVLNSDLTALDATTWPVGPFGPHAVVSHFTIPASVPAGLYTLQFAVVDRAGNPDMNLAIDTKDTTGLADAVNDYSYYSIGPIRINSSHSPEGDLDGNGHVDSIDLSLLLSHYGTEDAVFDLNADGQVDVTDLSILLTNYGR